MLPRRKHRSSMLRRGPTSPSGISRHQAALRTLDARAKARDQLSAIVPEVEGLSHLRRCARGHGRTVHLILHAARERALHRQVRMQEAPGLAIANGDAGLATEVVLGVASNVHAVLATLAPL